jgi:hypothetical protein
MPPDIWHAGCLIKFGKGETMNKPIAFVVLSLCMSALSFGAEHLVTHSVKVVGNDSSKQRKSQRKQLSVPVKTRLKP